MSRKLKIRFNIPYYTHDPEEILLWVGSVRGITTKPTAQPMRRVDHSREDWLLELDFEADKELELSYNYRVVKWGQTERIEAPVPHTLRLKIDKNAPNSISVYDRWIDPDPAHRYTDAPLAAILGYQDLTRISMPVFKTSSGDAYVFASPMPLQGTVALCGAHYSCGSWDPQRAIPLTLTRNGYVLQFPMRLQTEYKIILKLDSGEVIWEEGANRLYTPDHDGIFTLRYETPPKFFEQNKGDRPQLRGTAVPIFSLRTDYSYGIGDLRDAVELLEWQRVNHQNILQLLPIYDTTFYRNERDSYPYNAVTTYGIHPIYLNVRALPGYKTAQERAIWEEQARQLNQLESIDYVAVLRLKEQVMDRLFETWYKDASITDNSFIQFCEDQKEHLLPYALFCTIRDMNPGKSVVDFLPYSEVLEEWVANKSYLGENIEKQVTKHSWRQFYLYKQLEKLSYSAANRNILIKGDLPIGVARDSVDTWVYPELFHLDKEAGSPPDNFSDTGQDWGFPTYNWDVIQQDGYQWWKRRFSHMAQYFDAIRIDHILGFFRIWSIPAGTGNPALGYYVPALGYTKQEIGDILVLCNRDEKGLYHPPLAIQDHKNYQDLTPIQQQKALKIRDDYYYNRNEALWRQTAIERLSNVMAASDLLICGEDLGVLPKSIQEVLQSLEILSLEVLRMPKKLGRDFVLPHDIPELSVFTTSTHDMPSLRAWWASLTDDEQWALAKLYRFEDEITPKGLVRALMNTDALLLILPLQDWFVLSDYGSQVKPEDEQINVPEDPYHIWNYRMPGTISQLPKSLL